MQEIETERSSDPLDEATNNALLDAAKHVALHVNRFKPAAKVDSLHRKVCIDCDDVIPEARAKIMDVVRCMCCQEEEERFRRLRVS